MGDAGAERFNSRINCSAPCKPSIVKPLPNQFWCYRRARFLPPELLRPPRLRGTLAPFFRASERPMAIACLRLFTVLPLLPDLSVPFLRRRIALSTRFDAALPYFLRPEDFLAAIPSLLKGMLRRYLHRLAHVVPREATRAFC